MIDYIRIFAEIGMLIWVGVIILLVAWQEVDRWRKLKEGEGGEGNIKIEDLFKDKPEEEEKAFEKWKGMQYNRKWR